MRGVTESWRLSETLELLDTMDPMRIDYQLSRESCKVIVPTSLRSSCRSKRSIWKRKVINEIRNLMENKSPRLANGRHSMGVKGDSRWGSNVIKSRLVTAVSRSDSGLLSRAGFGRLGLVCPRQIFFCMGGWAWALRGKFSLGRFGWVGSPRQTLSRGVGRGWLGMAVFLGCGRGGPGSGQLSSLGSGAKALTRDSCHPWVRAQRP